MSSIDLSQVQTSSHPLEKLLKTIVVYLKPYKINPINPVKIILLLAIY